MEITLSTAKKLYQLYKGEELPASKCQNSTFETMLKDAVLVRKRKGPGYVVVAPSPSSLTNYLRNNFNINSLKSYINNLQADQSRRSNMIQSSSNSKTKYIRSFKGFLVNSYEPIPATLNGNSIIIEPPTGSFNFIFDFQEFTIDADVTVVGVENAENFRFIEEQKYLFENITPLFVSRYPQSKDLINWLKKIPNDYLHFGDFDFEGIKIFLNGYKSYLNDRSEFFIPENIEKLIQENGNKQLYNKQFDNRPVKSDISDHKIAELIKSFHKHKKVLEQEILIKSDS